MQMQETDQSPQAIELTKQERELLVALLEDAIQQASQSGKSARFRGSSEDQAAVSDAVLRKLIPLDDTEELCKQLWVACQEHDLDEVAFTELLGAYMILKYGPPLEPLHEGNARAALAKIGWKVE